MTVKELEQLPYLEKLIEKEKEHLETLRDAADVKAQVISGMPRASGVSDRIGDAVPRVVDAEKEIERNIEEYIRERDRLKLYIEKAANARIKLILHLRFVRQMQWQQVADEIGGKETEYSVKSFCYRYVEGNDGPILRTVPGQVGMFDN